MMRLRPIVLLAAGLLPACQSPRAGLPHGPAAYAVIPPPASGTTRAAYRIGPLDVLAITVFQEPELSQRDVQVDASGNLLMPLVGTVQARGKTAHQLSREIAERLGTEYLVDPQVTVTVTASVSQQVTVEGNVTMPGVYDITGAPTLLEALARARSPTRVARLQEVVVFRTIDGRRAGAVFDVAAIRNGRAPDPELLGGDVVVVGFDAVKGAFRDFLTTAPLVSAFRTF
ncbi:MULTISPECIES: polysaccharide biosynthesis/export family protein [Sphingomonas]|uniref:Polysaccharide biosynthesis/export family protein n=1 Tax=Sphingomonas molluscorum TaxID=418184 RepID=A0ABU8Q469_9SPHN|nr:polysaccharide biosynthesis/export family protein [Sphingomonas sp. JUb134]MBM7406066.1 polysaccharide export outer membrane protein [Sphingomonas sp. JUb134]